ncbi:MAG: HEAT repeat domain-containing protein, partial [Armatimonadetes bacterium]|nr:HEAT repeat domain-containing protein [Armatimonadota bacterium]
PVQSLEDWAAKEAVTQAVAFLKDPDRPVRDRIMLALVRVGTKSADNLQGVVVGSKDADSNVRKVCVALLQVFGGDDFEKGMALLVRSLPDTDPAVLRAALQIRNPQVADQIIAKVVESMKADPAARTPGADVLGALPARREQCVQALLPQLADKDDGICSGAAAALGKVSSPTPVPQLVEAMAKRSAQVRRVAIGAIALIADRSGEAALTEALANPDDDNEARAQAAVGLGRIATPTAIATLVKALSDDDLKVQVAAVDGLADAGEPAVSALGQAIRSSDERTRTRAAQALGGIATQAINLALIPALRDTAPDVRAEAARGLGFEGNGAAVAALTALLSDSDGTVAASGADALARIGASARPALARVLAGGEGPAYLAAVALAKQGAASVPDVASAARGSASAGRWAIVSLSQNKSQDALDALRDLSVSAQSETRSVAASALKRLSLQ